MNYTTILQNHHADLPCAFVDLDAFDANVRSIAQMIDGTNLKIRVATKSVRVPELIRRVLNSGGPYQGLMCYSAREAAFLADEGFDDFLIAYPTLSTQDLEALRRVHESGKVISLVLDDERQFKVVNDFMQGLSRPFPVLLEPDLALRIGPLTVGVRRSPLRSDKALIALAQKLAHYPNLCFFGLMAYEAQVAGVGDRNPFKKILNPIVALLRRYSMGRIQVRRKELARDLTRLGLKPELFNGGGTGSLTFNRAEKDTLSEVTAGSGFFCPGLFDYYSNFKLRPSAFFALQVVRNPEKGWYTCQGGGYVASGEPGWDRIPHPANPELKLSGFEATGEVQTPVQSPTDLPLGSPVIFRHQKAGELMERFNEVLLLRGEKIEATVKTYRGFGKSFF